MTKKSALFVLALVGLIGLTAGCRGDISGNREDAGTIPTIDTENARVLVGHWRKTTVMYENTTDSHLVLDGNGVMTAWEVTASSRSPTTSGKWSVEDKDLTLRLEGEIISRPFTIYKGQLIFPNIPNQRGFWEKIAQ